MLRTTPDFALLLKRMVEAEADFVLIGGLAMTARGCDHVTTDIDFAISRSRENARRVTAALAPEHPRPEEWDESLPYPWSEEIVRRATILTLLTDHGSLDLLAEAPGVESFEALKERASDIALFGYTVRVASIDDLIQMKRAANRPKDQNHIFELLALKKLTEPPS